MSALEKIQEERECNLEYVEWQEGNGKSYAYVLIKKIHLKAFKKALSERDVDLEKFGVVLAHGKGQAPEGLEEKLIKAVTKAA
jgi:hypothetical protein